MDGGVEVTFGKCPKVSRFVSRLSSLNRRKIEPGILMLGNKGWAKKISPLTPLTFFVKIFYYFYFNNQEKMLFLPLNFFTHKCADTVKIYDFFFTVKHF